MFQRENPHDLSTVLLEVHEDPQTKKKKIRCPVIKFMRATIGVELFRRQQYGTKETSGNIVMSSPRRNLKKAFYFLYHSSREQCLHMCLRSDAQYRKIANTGMLRRHSRRGKTM